MGRYVDSDGYVWEGAVCNCLECVSLKRHPEGKKGSPTEFYKCYQYGIWENDLRSQYGSLNHENNCPNWRPKS
jgi:hypothetical protein